MAGYRVLYGSSVVYEAGSDTRCIHDASVDMRTDGVSQFSFVMPPTHPLRNTVTIRDFAHPVQVYFDSQLLFQGFITRMGETMTTELSVTCASDLQLLADVHTRSERQEDDRREMVYTAPELFDYAIRNYNAKVPAARRFTIGHTIAAGAVGYHDPETGKKIVAVAATTPVGTLDMLRKSILDPYNCFLRVWYSGSTRYIGLYTSAPETNTQRIQFGENMTEFVMEYDTEDLFNGCLPMGGSRNTYRLENALEVITTRKVWQSTTRFYLTKRVNNVIEAKRGDILIIGDGEYQIAEDVNIGVDTLVPIEGELYETIEPNTVGYYVKRGTDYTSATLTLVGYPNGTYETDYVKQDQYVYHKASVERYGLKTFTFTDSNIMTQAALLSRAIAEIGGKIAPTLTLSITGVDMALYMSGYTHLVAGQKVRVVSAPHNFDQVMQVTKAVLSLDNPGRTKYVIGPIPKTATARTRSAKEDAEDVRDMLAYDMANVINGSEIMRLR